MESYSTWLKAIVLPTTYDLKNHNTVTVNIGFNREPSSRYVLWCHVTAATENVKYKKPEFFF